MKSDLSQLKKEYSETQNNNNKLKLFNKIKRKEQAIETAEKLLNSKIDQVYKLMSHDEFINGLFDTNPETGMISGPGPVIRSYLSRKNNVLIIDEIQKLISEPYPLATGSERGIRYWKMYSALKYYSSDTTRTFLLSGTPIYDKPYEIGLIINLFQPKIPFPLTRKKFDELFIDKNLNAKNGDLFQLMTRGYISYFKGGHPNAMAKKKVYHVKVPMSGEQITQFNKALERDQRAAQMNTGNSNDIDYLKGYLEDDSGFIVGSKTVFMQSRKYCNFAIDGATANERKTNLNNLYKRLSVSDKPIELISHYSTKFAQLIHNLTAKAPIQSIAPAFVYTEFVGEYGVQTLEVVLKALGFRKATSNNLKNSDLNYKRYAIFSGDTKDPERKFILETYNKSENKDGKLIPILIGTRSIEEGVSLKNVKQIHLLTPWWNRARLEQIVYRGIRYCSHTEPTAIRVYEYISTLPKSQGNSIEEIMVRVSNKKLRLTQQFEKLMKENSIDCELLKQMYLQRSRVSREDGYDETNDLNKESLSCLLDNPKEEQVIKSLSTSEQKYIRSQITREKLMYKMSRTLNPKPERSNLAGRIYNMGLKKNPKKKGVFTTFVNKQCKGSLDMFKQQIFIIGQNRGFINQDNLGEWQTKIFNPRVERSELVGYKKLFESK